MGPENRAAIFTEPGSPGDESGEDLVRGPAGPVFKQGCAG